MTLAFGNRRLVAQDDQAIVQRPEVQRSTFENEWVRLTTFNQGYLVPFLCQEILPGDHMRYEINANIRLATPLFPLFSNLRVDTHLFFIPNRLVWDNWERFQGAQDTPASSIAYLIPVCAGQVGGYSNNSIYDHFGLPTAEQIPGTNVLQHSALPLRGYNLTWNSWFRDQNIQDSLPVDKGNGPDITAYALQRRAKSHGYFESALPWAQKFTAPTIPVGGQAPVKGIAFNQATDPSDGTPGLYWETGGTAASGWAGFIMTTAATSIAVRAANAGASTGGPSIFADLASATGISINTLRQAWMIQSLLERDARGGTRYPEKIYMQYGVRVPDYRLQRPEYIGGGQSMMNISPIAQTAPTAGAPVGVLGGAGTASGEHHATYAAVEHGYILGLISVKSELAFQQGLERHWSRRTLYDFHDPLLNGLGEQAILRKEIYAVGDSPPVLDDLVFGYQERFHEYRMNYSQVTGMFKSNIAGTLDTWHLAQWFSAPPTLNPAFIEDNAPMSRVLGAGALADNQQFLAEILIHREATRPIPVSGVPALLGRF